MKQPKQPMEEWEKTERFIKKRRRRQNVEKGFVLVSAAVLLALWEWLVIRLFRNGRAEMVLLSSAPSPLYTDSVKVYYFELLLLIISSEMAAAFLFSLCKSLYSRYFKKNKPKKPLPLWVRIAVSVLCAALLVLAVLALRSGADSFRVLRDAGAIKRAMMAEEIAAFGQHCVKCLLLAEGWLLSVSAVFRVWRKENEDR